MSLEITVQSSIQYTKNGVSKQVSVSKQYDSATGAGSDTPQTISFTVPTAVTFPGVTGTPKQVMLINLDATYAVTLAADAPMASPFAVIRAGGGFCYEPANTTLYAQAATAAVSLLVVPFST